MHRSSRRVHFYKVAWRLGTPNIPWRSTEPNIGVESAPNAILSRQFLSRFFPTARVSSFSFPTPESIPQETHLETLVQSLQLLARAINVNFQPGETRVVIGGDHSVTLGSMMALLDRFKPKNIGYIQIDSHVDLLTYGRSVTKNFHGMFGRVLIDVFDLATINQVVPHKIPHKNVLYVGEVELDNQEKVYLETHGIPVLTRRDIRDSMPRALRNVQRFTRRFPHIHISFDIDVFDQRIVQATSTPSLSGFFLCDIFPILHVFAQHKSISVDLAEVNPRRTGSARTVAIAQKVLRALLR